MWKPSQGPRQRTLGQDFVKPPCRPCGMAWATCVHGCQVEMTYLDDALPRHKSIRRHHYYPLPDTRHAIKSTPCVAVGGSARELKAKYMAYGMISKNWSLSAIVGSSPLLHRTPQSIPQWGRPMNPPSRVITHGSFQLLQPWQPQQGWPTTDGW